MIRLTLSARLSLVFCALLLASSAAAAWLHIRANRMFEQELVQRLSSDVAEHIADSAEFMDANGLRPDAVRILFDQLMSVNPSVEVYLVDGPAGSSAMRLQPATCAASASPWSPSSDCSAASRCQSSATTLAAPGGQKVFDAARLELDGRPWGYVYVVLMGEARDVLAADVAASNVLRTTLWSMAVIALLGVLAGLVAFRQITRPLRALTADMHALDLDGLAAGGAFQPPRLAGAMRAMRSLSSATRSAGWPSGSPSSGAR